VDFILKKLKTAWETQIIKSLIKEVKRIAKDSLKDRNDTNTYYFSLDIVWELQLIANINSRVTVSEDVKPYSSMLKAFSILL